MPREKIEKIVEITCRQDVTINELIERVNTIDEDIVTIAEKQNVMIDKYNDMAEQVNVCKKLLQGITDAMARAKDKPKDIIVP